MSQKSDKLGLTPDKIVQELDRFIVGQQEAKVAVASALRTRYRRKLVPQPLRDEIIPKNILMIGPTGVGKTEIARRLAKLANSPFIKVEATKFTEVGYVGRDVESIIRDLVDIAINLTKIQAKKEVLEESKRRAVEVIIDILVGKNASTEEKENIRLKIHSGEINNKEVEIEIKDHSSNQTPSFDIPGMPGVAMGVLNIGGMIGKALGNIKTKKKKMPVIDAIDALAADEADKLLDEEQIVQKALETVENDGIVFIDEIDKITSRSDSSSRSGEVSREGVQRDLLPIIEGTTVATKHGVINTDHILFIASGAFHISKPSDLLPELQGRLPIRVELKALQKKELVQILTEPESSLIKQYIALIETEGLKLSFTEDGIDKIATYAEILNKDIENIGARRLPALLEKILHDISYSAHKIKEKKVVIDEKFVDERLSKIAKDNNLSKFIL